MKISEGEVDSYHPRHILLYTSEGEVDGYYHWHILLELSKAGSVFTGISSYNNNEDGRTGPLVPYDSAMNSTRQWTAKLF